MYDTVIIMEVPYQAKCFNYKTTRFKTKKSNMNPPQKQNEHFQLTVLLISHTHGTASIIFKLQL
jgi:hypothetical protein